MIPLALKLREIAVLSCLRGDALAPQDIKNHIFSSAATLELLIELRALGLVECRGREWSLTDDGKAWIRESGVAS